MDGVQQIMRQPARPMEPVIDPAAWYAQEITDQKAGIYHWTTCCVSGCAHPKSARSSRCSMNA
jgi:hypothetical protein